MIDSASSTCETIVDCDDSPMARDAWSKEWDDATPGGAQPGAGRKSLYPGTDLQRTFHLDMTPEGRRALEDIRARTGLTRNNILAHLIHRYAGRLRSKPYGVLYPGKLAKDIMTIRMSKVLGDKFERAYDRTGKSYSDLGEALVRRFGATETFPVLPGKDQKRKSRGKAGR